MKTLLALTLVLASAVHAADTPPPPPDLNAPPATALRQTDGLVTQQLLAGKGSEHPKGSDILRMRYTVWRSDGSVVTHLPGANTAMIPLQNMLPGWREAAMLMTAGEQQRSWIPSSLGGGKIPEGKSFVIDTELVEIINPPVTPADLAQPPPEAVVTKSGLTYKILRPGTGQEHPGKRSRVVVHYSGWTADGNLFDTSITRGEPSEFVLGEVIPGWTEGLQLMTPGEKARFWIPARLAYRNERGKPQGMLVFDIELVAIR